MTLASLANPATPGFRPESTLRWAIQDLYAEYAACLDSGAYEDWPDFFTDDCHYSVIPRENHERSLPLATIDLHGAGMLRDRVYAVVSTLYHGPYYQRHIFGPPRILRYDEDIVRLEVNYLVIRTKRDAVSEVFNAGRYLDSIAITAGGLKFLEKLCIFDSELIPNSLIYPI